MTRLFFDELLLNFEPFSVECTTCASRLRVTDPSLVGTIAMCPKCNSMVQIDPSNAVPTKPKPIPNQQVAVGSAQVDSEAITQDAINADSEHVDPSTAPRGFAADDTIPTESSDEYGSDQLGGPMPPTWQSERTQKSRQIGLVVALAGSGVLGAILLFGWFVKNWNAETPVAANVTQDPSPETTLDADPSKDATDEVTEQKVTDPEPTFEPDDHSVDEDPEVPTPQESEPDTQDNSKADPAAKADTQDPATTMDKEPDMEIPSDLLPDDPLGLGPITDGPASDADDKPDGPADIPDELKSVIDILNLGGEQKAPKLDTPATIEDVEIEGAADENIDPMLIANPPGPINFKSALAIEVAIATTQDRGYPLADLTLVISQITGIPVQIDWVAFDLAGINIRDRVTNLKSNGGQPVGDLLKQVAESIDAKLIQDDRMITLAPSDELVAKSQAVLLDLSDFGAGQATATGTINRFLTGGTSEKKLTVGTGPMDVELAALATEAMRRMRGLAPKVGDAVISRWAQSTTDPKLDWPLVRGGDPGPQYQSAIAVAGFLRRIARNNQAVCYINWYDANRRRMSPDQLVMPFMKTKVETVLANTLEPFALQVRRVDDGHWWVGTEATYDRFPVVVWTPPLGNDQDAFGERLRSAAAAAKFEMKMAVDPDTGRAILLLPRFIVRQIPKLKSGLSLTRTN